MKWCQSPFTLCQYEAITLWSYALMVSRLHYVERSFEPNTVGIENGALTGFKWICPIPDWLRGGNLSTWDWNWQSVCCQLHLAPNRNQAIMQDGYSRWIDSSIDPSSPKKRNLMLQFTSLLGLPRFAFVQFWRGVSFLLSSSNLFMPWTCSSRSYLFRAALVQARSKLPPPPLKFFHFS